VAGLSISWTMGVGLPALAIQTVSIALARALRVYSRSRLEEVCEANGRPDRADAIARDDERTERAAESLAVLSGLVMAVLIGVNAASTEGGIQARTVGALILGIAAVDYVVAGALGRVFAERLLCWIWPIAPIVRAMATPLTLVGGLAEWLAEAIWGRADGAPRPTSVEVEIPPDDDNRESEEADLPESTREMLEHVVELARKDVSEVMVPRSNMIMRPATISARDAAETFRSTGLSRIPLYGENRDDVVGILYAKDLFPALLDASDPTSVIPRRLVRPPHFVPETKMASELLDELRLRRLQIAIVLDEYGGVSGLITLEDLLEELVGPIDDEHDKPTPGDPVRPLGGGSYEVDASLPLEDINERLGLHLPTNGEVITLGGFAFHALGRLPEPGTAFRSDGIDFTVLEVADRSIRRMRLDLAGRT
jgi:CBS domain containing-hemolysin-like protein